MTQALIFVDTNILLDFYRIKESDISLKYINEMVKYKDLFLLTDQVEMEFKKKRQKVILDSSNLLRRIHPEINIPTIEAESKEAIRIHDSIVSIRKDLKLLEKKIQTLIFKPEDDEVYQSINQLFKSNRLSNKLNENEIETIYNTAVKRYNLGCPPRKDTDNSIGDAINWESIIYVSKTFKKSIIIVTRDSDYYCEIGNEIILNDWLKQEFGDRCEESCKLVITNKLSKAFKLLDVPVSIEMINAEIHLLDTIEKLVRQNYKLTADRINFSNLFQQSKIELKSNNE